MSPNVMFVALTLRVQTSKERSSLIIPGGNLRHEGWSRAFRHSASGRLHICTWYAEIALWIITSKWNTPVNIFRVLWAGKIIHFVPYKSFDRLMSVDIDDRTYGLRSSCILSLLNDRLSLRLSVMPLSVELNQKYEIRFYVRCRAPWAASASFQRWRVNFLAECLIWASVVTRSGL